MNDTGYTDNGVAVELVTITGSNFLHGKWRPGTARKQARYKDEIRK